MERRASPERFVPADLLDDLCADRVHRRQCRHRVLRDEGDLATADAAQAPFGDTQQRLTAERDAGLGA